MFGSLEFEVWIWLGSTEIDETSWDTQMSQSNILRFSDMNVSTVCPGSSDPPEKILNIFASEN